MKKKIYIAGSGGMLGEAFYHQFKDDFEIKSSDKDVNETWLSFLDFRDFLRPASGFQSIQFKILESKLGLKYENRYGQEYYLSQLKPEDRQIVVDAEKNPSIIVLLNQWLERFPFFQWQDSHSFLIKL